MTLDWTDHALYAALWLGFGAVHSLLAHAPLRDAWKRLFGPLARLAYNAVAISHFIGIVAFGHLVLFGGSTWTVPLPVLILQLMMLVAGGLLMGVAARSYDMGRFAGFHQLRHRDGGDTAPLRGQEDDEPLHTGGLHGRIRHPFYTAGMLLFWGLAQSEAGVATALWATAYFLIGARLEEHRLIRLFGERYRDYRRRVPAFLPRLFRA